MSPWSPPQFVDLFVSPWLPPQFVDLFTATAYFCCHGCPQFIDLLTSPWLQPQFIHLAQIWSGFQDEMVLLSVLSNILVSLEPYSRVSIANIAIEAIQVLRNAFFWKLDTHPPPRNTNNVEPHIFRIKTFSGKSDTLQPPTALRNT